MERWLLGAASVIVLVSLWSCVEGGTLPLAPGESTGVALNLSLIPSAADGDALPIHRIRVVTLRYEDGAVLDETVQEVSPSDAEWEVLVSVSPPVYGTIELLLYLIHVSDSGSEAVQFSGRTGPVELVQGEQLSPDVPIVRGPLANLSTTSVSISSAPTQMLEGESVELSAVTTTNDGAEPQVFWASLDDAVLEMTDQTAQALSIGLARVVASAGAFADTTEIMVLSSDTIVPTVVSTNPASGATGVPLGVRVSATFDEDLDPGSITAQTFLLTDSLGAPVSGSVAYAARVATLTPDAPLDSLAEYTVRLTTGVTDLVGNPIADDVTWSFTTAASASLLSSFDPGLGTLVAIAFDDVTGNLFIHDDFSDAIWEYTTTGTQVAPSVQRPGPSSNDIDLDFLLNQDVVGTTTVPANVLLAHNGEVTPGVLYAIDKDDGVVFDSVAIQSSGNPVGGAYHPQRGTFFSVVWNTDLIEEIDLSDGSVLASFTVRPAGVPTYDVFFGDLEVDPATGNLIIVSSAQNTIRIMDASGVFVRDIDVGGLGINGMSGVAWDASTSTAWISSTNGTVYQVGGVG